MFTMAVAVDYLAKKKFGSLIETSQLLANIETEVNGEGHKQLAEIDAFKQSLRLMPVSELEQLFLSVYQQDIKNEATAEAGRIYNQKQAAADFVHWSKAAHWTIDEALALSFGKEPELVNWKKIEPYKNKSPFVKAYAKRRELATRAIHAKKLSDPVMPVVFISWAKELRIELPSELLVELENVGNTAIDWQIEWIELKARYDELQTQANHSSLGNTQKTENLLKAFASIAIDAYGYDPKSQKSTTTNDILKALKSQGKTIDPKTIRTWLKEGIDLLPRKPL